jgi:galactokinase
MSFGALKGDLGVGTIGGSEDHTAMLCATAGRLLEFAYDPVRQTAAVDLPAESTFVVAFSGVSAPKTGEARERYNRAADLARLATERWNERTGRHDAHLGEALGSEGEGAARLRETIRSGGDTDATPDELLLRLEHFIAENYEVLPDAVQALQAGDLDRFGEVVDRSQALAEHLLGNQIEETSFLARSAREGGAFAASAFGAGFGGSVWAMVRCEEAARFAKTWEKSYRRRFPVPGERSRFFLSGAGPPVCILR